MSKTYRENINLLFLISWKLKFTLISTVFRRAEVILLKNNCPEWAFLMLAENRLLLKMLQAAGICRQECPFVILERGDTFHVTPM